MTENNEKINDTETAAEEVKAEEPVVEEKKKKSKKSDKLLEEKEAQISGPDPDPSHKP